MRGHMNEFGEHVKRLRGATSLRAVARDLGIEPSYLSKIENGEREPSDQMIERLATRLAVDHGELALRAGRLTGSVAEKIRSDPKPWVTLLQMSNRQATRVARRVGDG